MINISVSSLEKSATLKITALAKKLKREGKDIVNFAAGEPDFDTPIFIKEEAKKAIDEGFTKYTPSTGTVDLKEAIAKKLREENKISAEAKHIIVTTGAKYALFAAFLTLLNRGDEIILPSPYWVSYPQMARLAGAKIKILTTRREDNFKITAEKLKEALTDRSKIFILNYPNNPTGVTYRREELVKFEEIAREKNVSIISDEIYEKIIYDGNSHVSFASLPNAFSHTITINGFSKTFSMTGWRIGYLVAEEHLAYEASKIIDHTTSCASSISQRAALAALQNTAWPKKIRTEFQKRRDLLLKGLSECRNIEPVIPQGTFYLFCDIRSTGLSSLDFAQKLLEQHFVACIPADAFGAEGFLRLSFATSSEQIKKGIERIQAFLKNI